MFSFKNKIEKNLRDAMNENIYKEYRVLIKCKKFEDNISKKICNLKGSLIHTINSIRIISAYASSRVIERLLEFPEVEYICFDSYAHLCGSLSVSYANGIKFPEKYKLSGKNIGIGLIDSGVYPHQDLLTPNNKIKYFLDVINNIKYPYDDNGHGTFISGILCGSGYCSDGLFKGIAEKANLFVIKSFNATGKGYVSDVLLGLETLINLSEKNNIKVLCLPFEILEHNPFINSLFKKIFNIAIGKGLTPVVPSGSNPSKEDSIRGIAILDNCLTVGGLDSFKSFKDFEFSPSTSIKKIKKPDLLAASVNICSLNSDKFFISERNGRKLYPSKLEENYISYSGTSCSCAYISGLCALLYEFNNNLNFKDVVSLLKMSCELKDWLKYNQGEGLVNTNTLFSKILK